MARLFIAVDLPSDVKEALVALQPCVSPGVRLTDAEQMHVTLHYIGDADRDQMASALCTQREPTFSLSIQGVGQFQSPDGAVTLWAGIEKCDDLLRLHGSVASALSVEGYRPEIRQYRPHVTLARCAPALAAPVIDDFLARHANFTMPAIAITGFGLYSSEFIAGVPVYRREQFFPLICPDHKPGG